MVLWCGALPRAWRLGGKTTKKVVVGQRCGVVLAATMWCFLFFRVGVVGKEAQRCKLHLSTLTCCPKKGKLPETGSGQKKKAEEEGLLFFFCFFRLLWAATTSACAH